MEKNITFQMSHSDFANLSIQTIDDFLSYLLSLALYFHVIEVREEPI